MRGILAARATMLFDKEISRSIARRDQARHAAAPGACGDPEVAGCEERPLVFPAFHGAARLAVADRSAKALATAFLRDARSPVWTSAQDAAAAWRARIRPEFPAQVPEKPRFAPGFFSAARSRVGRRGGAGRDRWIILDRLRMRVRSRHAAAGMPRPPPPLPAALVLRPACRALPFWRRSPRRSCRIRRPSP